MTREWLAVVSVARAELCLAALLLSVCRLQVPGITRVENRVGRPEGRMQGQALELLALCHGAFLVRPIGGSRGVVTVRGEAKGAGESGRGVDSLATAGWIYAKAL